MEGVRACAIYILQAALRAPRSGPETKRRHRCAQTARSERRQRTRGDTGGAGRCRRAGARAGKCEGRRAGHDQGVVVVIPFTEAARRARPEGSVRHQSRTHAGGGARGARGSNPLRPPLVPPLSPASLQPMRPLLRTFSSVSPFVLRPDCSLLRPDLFLSRPPSPVFFAFLLSLSSRLAPAATTQLASHTSYLLLVPRAFHHLRPQVPARSFVTRAASP